MSLKELLHENNLDIFADICTADNVIVDGTPITADLTTINNEITALQNDRLLIDFSNAPVTDPGVTQEINIVKSVPNFGIIGATYMSTNQLYQDIAISDNLILGVGAGANRNVRLEIGQTNSCVRVGPWAERNTLIFSNDSLPIVSKHQSVGIGSLTYNDMNFQVRNSGAPFTFAHGTAPTTSQNRMILTNTSLSFAGGNYSILDPDGNITIGTNNTTINNSVIIPSQSNTMMYANSIGLAVIASTARLFNVASTTAFSTGFTNVTGQYSCVYTGQKTRTFSIQIDFSYTHSSNNTVVTIFVSKNGALTQVTHSAQITGGVSANVNCLNFTEQVTLNLNDTIQIGIIASNSGTLTAVYSAITCTALLTV
jgi:hypothetical protein